MSVNNIDPCRGCTERELGCHSKCDNYKAYLERNEKIKQARAKHNEFYKYVYSHPSRRNT